MISSAVIFGLYLIGAITTLLLIKCRVSILSGVILSTYFYSFGVKAVSDAMRYNQTRLMDLITSFTSISNRINILAIIYLSFLVKDVEIKLRSQSYDEFKGRQQSFKRLKISVYIVYSVLTIPVTVLTFLRVTDIPLTVE